MDTLISNSWKAWNNLGRVLSVKPTSTHRGDLDWSDLASHFSSTYCAQPSTAVGIIASHSDSETARLVFMSLFTEDNTEAKRKGTQLGLTAYRWLMLGAQGPLGRETGSSHPHLGLVAAISRDCPRLDGGVTAFVFPDSAPATLSASPHSGFALTCPILYLGRGKET